MEIYNKVLLSVTQLAESNCNQFSIKEFTEVICELCFGLRFIK